VADHWLLWLKAQIGFKDVAPTCNHQRSICLQISSAWKTLTQVCLCHTHLRLVLPQVITNSICIQVDLKGNGKSFATIIGQFLKTPSIQNVINGILGTALIVALAQWIGL
jgi:hypothetical protein